MASLIRKKLTRYSLYFFTLCNFNHVLALPADKDQPIEILADSAELDEKKGMTIYRGNVIVTQGSIKMTGDEMTVYLTGENDIDNIVLVGRPATYKQLPENSEIYDEAEALRMEYHEQKSLIILINKALVKQEGLSFSGNRIEYDTENSHVIAKSGTSSGDDSSTDSGKERVKIIINPKKKKK